MLELDARESRYINMFNRLGIQGQTHQLRIYCDGRRQAQDRESDGGNDEYELIQKDFLPMGKVGKLIILAN
jgi:hypothetical protein